MAENPTTSTTSEYTAITKNVLIENTKVEFDLFLRNDVSGQARYVLFCRADEKFSSEKQEQLLSKNTQRLYISSKDSDKYLQYQEKNLKQIIEDKSKSPIEKSETVYQVAKFLTKDLLSNPRSGEHVDRVSDWTDNTVDCILHEKDTFASFLKVISNDYQTYTHSINVAVIGLLFGKYLSLKQHELNCLGTGLLLHDIGKSAISSDIINKAGFLTEKEMEIMKKHPKAGLDILACKESINGMSLKIVIQHHENQDGTGYPYGLGGSDIHLFGSMSRILDVYDAMTSKRHYADAKRPFATLAEMKNTMSNCFNMELLKEFICFLGPTDSRKEIRASDTVFSFPSLTK